MDIKYGNHTIKLDETLVQRSNSSNECPQNTFQPDAYIFQPENGSPKFAQICFRSEDEYFDPLNPINARAFFVPNEGEMFDTTAFCKSLQTFYPSLNLGVCENNITPYGQISYQNSYPFVPSDFHPYFGVDIINGNVPILVQTEGGLGDWFTQEVAQPQITFQQFVALARGSIKPIPSEIAQQLSNSNSQSFAPQLQGRESLDPIVYWTAGFFVVIALIAYAFPTVSPHISKPDLSKLPKVSLPFGKKK